jgi:hypothetical protein
MPITALPRTLRENQTIVHGDGSLERLYNFINNALPPSVEKSEREKKQRLEKERHETELKERLQAERQKKESEHLETEVPLSSSGETRSKRKSSPKQVIGFLAIAAVMVVAGLIYFGTRVSQSSPPPPQSLAKAAAAGNPARKKLLDAADPAKGLLDCANAGDPDCMLGMGEVHEFDHDYDGARYWYQRPQTLATRKRKNGSGGCPQNEKYLPQVASVFFAG